MHRLASKLFAYALAVVLLVAISALCAVIVKSATGIHPAIVFGVGICAYTMSVLYILHRRAGTLEMTPEEIRERQMAEEADADAI